MENKELNLNELENAAGGAGSKKEKAGGSPTPLPYKESEMRAASSLPKLYALIEEGEEPAWVQELRKDAQGKYTLLVIKGNEEMKQFFNVESLPMIILMDADGHEISRKIPR